MTGVTLSRVEQSAQGITLFMIMVTGMKNGITALP